MSIVAFFIFRVGNPQVHIGVVRIPSEYHANIYGFLLEQALVYKRSADTLLCIYKIVNFVHNDQLYISEAIIPRTFHNLVEGLYSLLIFSPLGESLS